MTCERLGGDGPLLARWGETVRDSGAGASCGVVRTRRSDCSRPGIARRRRGKGFSYYWEDTGEKVVDSEVLQRISDLVLPPAWRDVWVCPIPNGHLQAVGTDAAGRKQYRYHDDWRRRRDAAKFDEMLEFARVLPDLRDAVAAHLATEGVGRDRVLACAVRLLDRVFFRIGTEVGQSGDTETFGLTTIRKEHAAVDHERITFTYDAKGGKRQIHALVDPEARDVIAALKRRRAGSDQLLAFREGRRWVDVTARDVNEWIKQQTGGDYSAKDFRTWNATVLAAVALAVSGPAAASRAARKRAAARAAKEVGDYLGNTPAVARTSYIDPRVFDRYDSGWTISGADIGNAEPGELSIHSEIEDAVLDLLARDTSSAAVEKVTALAS